MFETHDTDDVHRPDPGAERGSPSSAENGTRSAQPSDDLVVSVVIPAYNAAGTLGVQLEALAHQTFDGPWEVIVADNGSSDATLDVARSYADRLPLRLVDAKDVRGAAHARNVGARAAQAPLLAFVDADDEVDHGWLSAVVASLEDHDAVASRFDLESLNAEDVAATREVPQQTDLNRNRFLPHASASGLAVHRYVHDAIGGFEETLLHLQDTDYCWRLQLQGFELQFAGDALVHYRLRETVAGSTWQSFGYGRYDGHLYHRYRSFGAKRASLGRSLTGIAKGTFNVAVASLRHVPHKELRSLAHTTGFALGWLEAGFRSDVQPVERRAPSRD